MTKWTEGLSEELQANESLNRFESLDDLAQGYLTTKAEGSQSLRVPPAESGPDVRAKFITSLIQQAPEVMLKPTDDASEEFFRVLGKPEETAGYTNPDGYESLGDDVESQIRDMALNANLTDAQYQSVILDMSGKNNEATKIRQTMADDAAVSLKNEWGATHEDRMGKAKQVNDEFFPDVDFASLSPADIKGRYEFSTRLSGKPQASDQPMTEKVVLTPAEALKRQQEIMGRDAYWDAAHPEHEDLKKRVVQLGVEAGQGTSLETMRANPFL